MWMNQMSSVVRGTEKIFMLSSWLLLFYFFVIFSPFLWPFSFFHWSTKAVFTLGARAPCPGSILRRAPMWTHLFSWYPRQNSGTVPVPEYKVSTLYSGTKLGTESLCEHIFRWCPGTLPTNHLFSYPQFLVPLEISIVSVCSVYWMWTYLQTGYRVSEHSTILCRCPGTSARAPSVNTA